MSALDRDTLAEKTAALERHLQRGQRGGLNSLRGNRKRRLLRRLRRGGATTFYCGKLERQAFQVGFASLGRARLAAGRVECGPVRS